MAEGLSTAEANALIDEIRAAFPYMQLHTGAPGAAGNSNIAGNTTRKQVTTGAASGGASTNTVAVTWSAVPTAETYTRCSFWPLASGGNIAIGQLSISFPVAS